ncbi:MAG: STAS domain-containing protein [Phycisphaerales bacterium]|jgi:anti-anti-sigma factor|nr:STAS domain-containing protein [Phycisphaeraceae bacterium]
MLQSTLIKAKMIDGVLVATIVCEKIGQYETGIIEGELLPAVRNTGHRLALDFSSVQLVSSVGLGMLVTLNRNCRAGKGKMAIFGLSDNLTHLLKATKLDSGLTLVRDESSAVKAAK